MHSSDNYLSNHHPIFVNGNNKDISKHMESLRTRLGFARFKLRNGWEKNSLGDVECFWKQKQRQLIKEIPKPRFTQQDIIDKRSYIPATGAKCAKSKRPKHQPRSNIQKKRHVYQPIRSKDHDDTTFDSQQLSQQTYFFHHYSPESSPSRNVRNHSISSFDASSVPNDLNGEPSNVRNSLDYLSYAIAMTEQGHSPARYQRQNSSDHMPREPTLLEDDGDEDEDTDINLRDDVSPDWTRTSQLRLSLSIPNQFVVEEENKSSPSSPASATNAAAQAMLMFVNREHAQRDQSPSIHAVSTN